MSRRASSSAGGHREPLDLDQLLDAVDDEEPPVTIGACDVAGAQPAVHERRGRRPLVVQVALHHLRAAEQQLALPARLDVLAGRDVHDASLGAGRERPDAAGSERRADWSHVRDGADFREAVALHDLAAQALRAGPGELGVEGRRSRQHGAQGRQVVVRDERVLGEGEHERWRDVGERRSVLLRERQVLLEVEARHRHDGRPIAEGHVHDHRLPVAVEERQDAHDDVLRPKRPDRGCLQHVGHEVAMREHDTLGKARRAARVRERDDVLGSVDLQGRRVFVRREERGERRRALGLAEDEDLLHLGLTRCRERALEERRDREQEARAGVPELEGELVHRVERVRRRARPAGRGHPVEGDRVLGHVRAVDADDLVRDAARVRPGPRRTGGRGGRAQRRSASCPKGRPRGRRGRRTRPPARARRR